MLSVFGDKNIEMINMIMNFPFRQTTIEISAILRNLITVIFCYQISLKSLKTLSLSQVIFPSDFPLCYSFPYEFTNSDKGKNKNGYKPSSRFPFFVTICAILRFFFGLERYNYTRSLLFPFANKHHSPSVCLFSKISIIPRAI